MEGEWERGRVKKLWQLLTASGVDQFTKLGHDDDDRGYCYPHDGGFAACTVCTACTACTVGSVWACVDTVDTLAVGLDLLIAAQTDSDTKGRPDQKEGQLVDRKLTRFTPSP